MGWLSPTLVGLYKVPARVTGTAQATAVTADNAGKGRPQMNDTDDERLLKRQRHFLLGLEREIRQVNNRILHERLPGLDRAAILGLAERVAELRSEYLGLVMELCCRPMGEIDAEAIRRVGTARKLYDEGRAAFHALERAIERGYIDLPDDPSAHH